MKFLRFLFNFYVQGSIHVAFGVLALTLLSAIYLNVQTDFYLLGFVFCAAVSGYNFVKYAGIAKWHHKRLTTSLRSIQVFSLLVFFMMLFFFWQLSFSVQLIAVISGFLTILYAVPLNRKWKNFRAIPGLKLVLIALVLVLITVIFPAFYKGKPFDCLVFIMSVLRFFWVIVLMLPFEIRDIHLDHHSLETIPQKWGVFKTKLAGTALVGGLAFAEIYFNNLFFNSLWVVVVVLFLTVLALWFSTEKRPFYFTAFWVEGIPMVWFLFERLV